MHDSFPSFSETIDTDWFLDISKNERQVQQTPRWDLLYLFFHSTNKTLWVFALNVKCYFVGIKRQMIFYVNISITVTKNKKYLIGNHIPKPQLTLQITQWMRSSFYRLSSFFLLSSFYRKWWWGKVD